MERIKRCSPVSFEVKPLKTEMRENWEVALELEGETQGNEPRLIDLSHKSRWDFQDPDLAKRQLWGMNIPDTPGCSVFGNRVLINRMNKTQASIWNLSEENLDIPDDQAFSDVTDASIFLALMGKNIFAITEKLTALDFLDPSKKTPFLLQGPFSHVPCQLVLMGNISENPCLLLTCSRGYAQTMTAAILSAGAEFKLQPAGEIAFSRWLK
jgi:hypothetical protein